MAAQTYPGCDYHENTVCLTDGFVHPYSIVTAPGREKSWTGERPYKNANILGSIVSVGDTVFVRVERKEDIEPLPEKPTSQQQLAYDQQYAVAKILEIRAASPADVWVLVAYYYWPKELEPPSLRSLPRWVDGELILSNHLQIIDVTNIDCTADVTYWDDEPEQDDKPDRFWRYTFRSDLCRTSKNPDVLLAKPRPLCPCGSPGSAKRILSKCSNQDCEAWLHEDCILDNIGMRAYEAYKQGSLDEFAQMPDESIFTSIATRVVGAVRNASAVVGHSVETVIENGIAAIAAESLAYAKTEAGGEHEKVVKEERIPLNAPQSGRKTVTMMKSKAGSKLKSTSPVKSGSNRPPWKQVLDLELLPPPYTTSVNMADTTQPTYVKIRELGGQQREWTIRTRCLVCGCAN